MDQACVLAIQHAQENLDFYGPELAASHLVWEVIGQEETDDYYHIQMSFRPGGRFRGRPGVEHLTIDKVGVIQVRQLVNPPIERATSFLPFYIGIVAVGMVSVIGVLIIMGGWPFGGGDPEPTPVPPPATKTPTPDVPPTIVATMKPTPKPVPEKSIILAYDGWAGSYLPMYVLKQIFEEDLGYQVQVADQKTIPEAFRSVSSGDTDIFTSAWFPLREFTLEKYTNLVKLGEVYGGKERDAFEGLMLSVEESERFSITGLEDLALPSLINALDADADGTGNLIGCPPTWVCKERLPEILEEHGLTGLYEIEEQQSETSMLAAIADRVGKELPALFYMYQPVAFPDDLPVMDRAIWLRGTEAYLPLAFDRTIVRGDFLAIRPGAATVLQRYRIPGADISRSMRQIEAAGADGTTSEFLAQLARDWIENNRESVNTWTQGVARRPELFPRHSIPGSLTVAYSPDKENLFLDLVTSFNASRPPNVLPIHPVMIDPSEMVKGAAKGKFDAITPDSLVWVTELEKEWQKEEPGASTLAGAIVKYALSPIVIAMLEETANQMGYPESLIDWQDLADQVDEDPTFKWSHPPVSSATGLLTTTAVFHAGSGKSEVLTPEDLESADGQGYLNDVEATVERYGSESEDRIITRLLAQRRNPLDAFVAQEQSVIRFNRRSEDKSLVAIYPPAGTFSMDHPLVLLDGPWVKLPQQRAFEEFAKFLTQDAQQQRVLRRGFRPSKEGVSLKAEESVFRPEFNVDPNAASTPLTVPSDGVLEEIRGLWRRTKKPANMYLVVDVSGSMAGQKLDGVKEALITFIDQVEGDRDQLRLVTFSDEVNEVESLHGPQDKEALKAKIRALNSGGSTELYKAVTFAIDRLEEAGGQDRINAIIAMTDGKTQGDIAVLDTKIRRANIPVLLFTVGYGKDADNNVLVRIARLGNGQAYEADPATIDRLYELLSSFF